MVESKRFKDERVKEQINNSMKKNIYETERAQLIRLRSFFMICKNNDTEEKV